jgi:hypothetical protein
MPRIRPIAANSPPAKPPRELEARDISVQALALAKRADVAGFASAAYLLDMAALTLADEIGVFGDLKETRQ